MRTSRWAVTDTFLAGKHSEDPARCEDVIVTGDLYAVIDGATDKSGLSYTWRGEHVTSGRFAALCLAERLRSLDPGLTPAAAAAELTAALDDALTAQHPNLPATHRPAASAAVFNPHREEIWWFGDCRHAIRRDDGHVHQTRPELPVDAATSTARAAYLAALTAAGHGWDPASGTPDPGRAFILPLLTRQGALANHTGPFGHSAFNGTPIPRHLIGQAATDGAVEIVLASDGYPDLAPNGRLRRADAETHLADALTADPACIGPLRGTKAMTAGLRSFDDRAWLHLTG